MKKHFHTVKMNYIYTYLGSLPNHIFNSFDSVKNIDKNSKIFLITDNDQNIDGVETIRYETLKSDQTNEAISGMLKSKKDSSFFRLFFVRDAMKKMNIEECYHFDPDVLMFQSPKMFEDHLKKFDGLYITPVTKYEVVFGFSRMGSHEKINKICDVFFNEFIKGKMGKKYNFEEQYQLHGLEMKVLKEIQTMHPELIKSLPVFPNGLGFVFDPSSYGIYLGNSFNKKTKREPGWIWPDHFVGEELMSGNIKVEMINNKPYVTKNNFGYPLINLHIHSKNTHLFEGEKTNA